MACEFCTEPIALDQPCTELMCRHKVHTECILRQSAAHDILNLRCAACREFVVPRQIMEEAEAVHGEEGQREVIRFFWENEPQFKTGLEAMRNARTVARLAQNAATKKAKEISGTMKTEVEPLVAQIRDKVRAAKATFKALPEQKEAAKAAKSVQMKMVAFRRRWGIGMWAVRSALRDIAAARVVIDGAYGAAIGRRMYAERQFNVNIS